LSTFQERLREERTRLGFSMLGLATLTGMSKQSQWSYEKGKSQPTVAYLSRLAVLGVDVTYLLTATRSVSAGIQELTGEELLLREKLAPTEKERLLLVRLRGASKQFRQAVWRMFAIESE
jgi:transcriptional regulator with XRE-family HTH domain